MIRSKVVLPQPEGPMNETKSPASICRSTFDNASTLPSEVSKVSESPCASIASGAGMAASLSTNPIGSDVCMALLTADFRRWRSTLHSGIILA